MFETNEIMSKSYSGYFLLSFDIVMIFVFWWLVNHNRDPIRRKFMWWVNVVFGGLIFVGLGNIILFLIALVAQLLID